MAVIVNVAVSPALTVAPFGVLMIDTSEQVTVICAESVGCVSTSGAGLEKPTDAVFGIGPQSAVVTVR